MNVEAYQTVKEWMMEKPQIFQYNRDIFLAHLYRLVEIYSRYREELTEEELKEVYYALEYKFSDNNVSYL